MEFIELLREDMYEETYYLNSKHKGLCRTDKLVNCPTTETCSPTNHALLMPHLGNVNL